jgi:hypothetical protein
VAKITFNISFCIGLQMGGNVVKGADSFEKSQLDMPETAESPRVSDKMEGGRSRNAKRAFAGFRVSRSVSTERVPEANPDTAENFAAWNHLEAGRLQASVERREEIGECQRFVNGVPLLTRRLSMGDSRVDESGSFERRLSWNDLVRFLGIVCHQHVSLRTVSTWRGATQHQQLVSEHNLDPARCADAGSQSTSNSGIS